MNDRHPRGFSMRHDPLANRPRPAGVRERTTEQRLNRATPFRPDDRMEHLLEMRDQQPEAFAALPPNVHIAVGLYESDKTNHQQITGGTE